ncbi:quinone oxidoreductase family protein [Mucilaginibacter jinjuensis]|uniref:Quinone oxidoreductase n=1 Tax=Mucilaginibacter jinjuensis TaxID=1176721 RepID=A0ABY7TFI7_9SPHI|nr:quinone oxidoreductase [Mucilaginibacter jinjuensis]WCT14826.1 quinone oxidoreductase [Mucilaginibacter jinjuensis]
MKALCFDIFGSPDVLYYGDVADRVIGDDEVMVKTKAIGLNFADTYRRNGNYHLVGQPPFIAGYEGAGEIVQIGKNISHLKIGDRIGFADVPLANAELVAVPASHAIPLPTNIGLETAAAMLLQGLTAQYLTTDSYQVKPGNVILVHAAAGGVGQLLVQLSKHFGATVIGLTSSAIKKQNVINAGADDCFLYNEDWKKQLVDKYKGVDVVYESIGSTLMDSFEVTKTGGTIVFFGFAGGNPPLIDPRMLMDTSKTITGGDLWSYLTSAEERLKRSAELFNWIEQGVISVDISRKFALSDGAAAHAFLESRQSTGKILLIP